jgi:hypothetical protein
MDICYVRVIKLDIARFWKNFFGMTIRFAPPLGLMIEPMVLTWFTGLALFTYAGTYTVLFCATAYFLCANEYEKRIVKKVVGGVTHKIKRR